MTPQINYREDRNRLLVEWSTAVFAIFWGVWWAHIADGILSMKCRLVLTEGLKLSFQFIAIISVAYAALFTFFYVKWMWHARTFHWNIGLRSFIGPFVPLSVAVIGPLLVSYALRSQAALPARQFAYGAALSVAWILTVTAIVLQSENWM